MGNAIDTLLRASAIGSVLLAGVVLSTKEGTSSPATIHVQTRNAYTAPVEQPAVTLEEVTVQPEVQRLFLERHTYSDRSTIGSLYIDSDKDNQLDRTSDERVAYTLELTWRNNTPFKSSIPPGIYALSERKSQKFNYKHWKLSDVPNRTDILIHGGNSPQDISGCILVGDEYRTDWVSNSRSTLRGLAERFYGTNLELEIVDPMLNQNK